LHHHLIIANLHFSIIASIQVPIISIDIF